jgi:hypothetical protein
VVIVLALAVSVAPGVGETASQPAPATAPESGSPSGIAALGLKGFLLYKNFSFFDETPTDNRHVRNEGLLELEWARRLAPWADARLVVDVRGDDDDLTDGVTFQIPDTAPRRSILAVKEATLAGRFGPAELTVGKQIFAWGTADGYNPTDNLNPYDYLDPIDYEKLGVWSASARVTAGPANLAFVMVPFFTPSRTPILGSRWAPLPPPGPIVDDREVPGRDIDNVQYGARLRGTVRGVDLSVSYFDGFDHLPAVRESSVTLGGVTVPRFTPIFTRMKVLGADVSTTFGKLEVHGEAAAKLVERDGRHDRFQAIVGVNYAWDELGLSWLEQVALIAEYARETFVSGPRREDVLDPIALRAFRDTALARLAFKFSEETSLKVTAVLDFIESPNHYLQAKLSHKLTDALHVEGGLDFFGGPRETLYGRWRDNDRVFVFVKYYF